MPTRTDLSGIRFGRLTAIEFHSRGLRAQRDELVSRLEALTAAQQPAEGEEIMVNTPYDVFTLPLRPSGLSSGPRFVVHVPGPDQQPAAVDEAVVEAVARAICVACEESPDHQGDARGNEFRWQDYRGPALAAISALAAQHQEPTT